jgi:pimeloyl-ACP methyl ester carboxylesterase
MTESRRESVAVDGGELAIFRMGDDGAGAPALAIHGITANAQAWRAVARAAGDGIGLAAVDLRGRGESRELPPPFGIAAHVRDMISVLDHLGLERAVVIGHSLGAYIAASLAAAHPERVAELVLVDGGLTIPGSEGADPEQFLQTFLGPTLARLTMTFPDLAAYLAWWRDHPAFAAGGVEASDLEAYAGHDLIGEPPFRHSGVNPEVVRVDGTDLFRIPDARTITGPATLLCAERGMVDDPHPMQPWELVEAWASAAPEQRRAVPVADVNHYTIVMGRTGAEAVASELRRAVVSAAVL